MIKGRASQDGVTLKKKGAGTGAPAKAKATATAAAAPAKAGAPAGSKRTRQRARQQERAKAAAKRRALARAEENGRLWLAVPGWLLTLAGAVSLAVIMAPRWAAVVGGGFDYVADPAPVTAPLWPTAIAILGSLLGFNPVYFGSGAKHRRSAMTVMAVLLGAQLLAVVAGTIWMLGAGRPGSSIVGNDGSSSALGPLIFVLLCTFAAALIMAWLGGNSTFDKQRREYFGKGRATVGVRPLGLPARFGWAVGALVLVVGLAVVPARLAADHLDDAYSVATRYPWPQPWDSDSDFAALNIVVAMVSGLLLGVCVSMLVKTVLYRTVLSRWTALSSRRVARSFGLRALRFFQHWPIALAGMWWTYWLSWAVPEEDVGNIPGGTGVPLLLGFVPLALGLLLLSQMWRAQDQTGAPRPMRLFMGGNPQ